MEGYIFCTHMVYGPLDMAYSMNIKIILFHILFGIDIYNFPKDLIQS